jgi:hypothetical protein
MILISTYMGEKARSLEIIIETIHFDGLVTAVY